jgi:anti-sigma factor RsiW
LECNDRFEGLLDLVIGELSAPERAEMESHIADCPVCRRRVDSLKALETRIADTLRDPPPQSDPTESIMAHVMEHCRVG